MTATAVILIMIFSTSSEQGGVGIVQQEFSSMETCEQARIVLAKAHSGNSRVLAAQGCFKK